MFMKKIIILIFLLLFIIACAQQSSQNNTVSTKTSSKTQTTAKTTTKTTSQTAAPTATSEPKIKSCDLVNNKVIVIYDNGQKESFSSYCPEKDEPAFKSFINVYYCDGLTVKSRMTRCTNNQTCSRGVCV